MLLAGPTLKDNLSLKNTKTYDNFLKAIPSLNEGSCRAVKTKSVTFYVTDKILLFATISILFSFTAG